MNEEDKQEPKANIGRPKIKVDEELLYKLSAIHCTMKEMVDILGVSEDTLKRRYAGVIAKGKAEGKMRLRRKQVEVAMQGNATLLIWLGKNCLGQSDSPTNEDEQSILPWSDDIDAT
tara:strand:+ start:570 stop:920 length:351 start_codon:yes stop_codon:yes gene_type:complete